MKFFIKNNIYVYEKVDCYENIILCLYLYIWNEIELIIIMVEK